MTTTNNCPSKLIRLPKLIEMTGGSRSWIYQQISEGKFPKPVKIGKRSSAWVESEIDEWIQQRMKNR